MSAAKNEKVVRSIDVGYGNVKYIQSHNMATKELKCGQFPAIAQQASHNNLESAFMNRRDNVIVRVGEVFFEVGRDSRLATEHNYTRKQDVAYSTSDPYLALTLGALYYMAEPKIDMLMIGLPCSTYMQYKDKLTARMVGKHTIPNPNRRGPNDPETIAVEIVAANVIPQPMGAYFDYGASYLKKDMPSRRTLVVDVGYFTLDWLVAQGFKPVGDRTNSLNDGGVKSILERLAKSLSKDIGEQVSDLSSIETALMENKPARFHGKDYPLDKYMDDVKALTRQHAAALSRIGTGQDIDNIVLAGGGAALFKDAVADQFPKHAIHVMESPEYSNVRGFQLLGAEWILKNSIRRTAD